MLFPCSLFRASAALLALGALPLSAAEQPDPAQARPVVSITDLNPVRLTRDAHSKLLVAQCTINGVPCNLIVDTAASHTTFDIKFIKKNFPGLPLENAQIAPGSNVNTVPQLFAMKTFSIGGLHIKNFFGLAMDLTPLQKDMQVRVDGILGINYLGFSPFLLSVRDASLQFLERSRFPSQNMKPHPEFSMSAAPGEETPSCWPLIPVLPFPWPRWNSGPRTQMETSSRPRPPTSTDTAGTATS